MVTFINNLKNELESSLGSYAQVWECHLLHAGMFGGKFKKPSLFLDWIPQAFRTDIYVDKNSWK